LFLLNPFKKKKKNRGLSRSARVRRINAKINRGQKMTPSDQMFWWTYSDPKRNKKGKEYSFVKKTNKKRP
jgi:hypothetical protein